MKLSKKSAFGCLVLCFAVLFGGCRLLPFGGSEPPKSNTSSTKENNTDAPDTESRRTGINSRIEKINSENTELTKKQEDAIRKILNLEDKSIEIGAKSLTNAGKKCSDEDQKKPSADCKEFLDYKGQITRQKEELSKAQEELKNLPSNKSGNPTPTPIEPESNNFWTLLLYAVGSVAGLAVLGGLGFLAYHFLGKKINQERGEIKQNFSKTESVNQKLTKRVDELEKAIKLQSQQFGTVGTELQKLKVQIAKISGQPYQPIQVSEQISAYNAKPQFPVSAEEYLNEVRAFAKTASADVIAGLLIPDSGKGDEFLIVKDSELSENLFYAVPNQIRFNTKGEYLNYYQNYYAFENPSSGSILIKSPTIVRRVQGGLKLEKMGELEVR